MWTEPYPIHESIIKWTIRLVSAASSHLLKHPQVPRTLMVLCLCDVVFWDRQTINHIATTHTILVCRRRCGLVVVVVAAKAKSPWRNKYWIYYFLRRHTSITLMMMKAENGGSLCVILHVCIDLLELTSVQYPYTGCGLRWCICFVICG